MSLGEKSTYGSNKTNNHPSEDRLWLNVAAVTTLRGTPWPFSPSVAVTKFNFIPLTLTGCTCHNDTFEWRLSPTNKGAVCLWGLWKLLHFHFGAIKKWLTRLFFVCLFIYFVCFLKKNSNHLYFERTVGLHVPQNQFYANVSPNCKLQHI